VWLLVLRGISIELRNHGEGPVWRPLWDAVFGGASLLLAVVLGAALGNVVRGVPLDGSGRFFVPLWTDFRTDGHTGVLDWYTVLVGAFALAALTVHGSIWVAHKTAGDLQARCRTLARRAWGTSAALAVAATAATFAIQPLVPASFRERPWFAVFPLLALAGLVGTQTFLSRGDDLRAFLASSLFLLGMMLTAVAGIYPTVLPSSLDPAHALTVASTAAPDAGLRIGLGWWIPGMALVVAYFVFTYRRFAGKVGAEGEGY